MAYPHLLAILAALNLPIYFKVYRAFFDDVEELAGGLSTWNRSFWSRMSDAISGRMLDNQWAGAKLLVALVLCGLLVLAEYGSVLQYAPGVARWLQLAW
jgi:hypothetical protein